MASPDDKFELALKEFDALIRQGEPNLVRPRLQAMAQAKLLRKFRLPLASIAVQCQRRGEV